MLTIPFLRIYTSAILSHLSPLSPFTPHLYHISPLSPLTCIISNLSLPTSRISPLTSLLVFLSPPIITSSRMPPITQAPRLSYPQLYNDLTMKSAQCDIALEQLNFHATCSEADAVDLFNKWAIIPVHILEDLDSLVPVNGNCVNYIFKLLCR